MLGWLPDQSSSMEIKLSDKMEGKRRQSQGNLNVRLSYLPPILNIHGVFFVCFRGGQA